MAAQGKGIESLREKLAEIFANEGKQIRDLLTPHRQENTKNGSKGATKWSVAPVTRKNSKSRKKYPQNRPQPQNRNYQTY